MVTSLMDRGQVSNRDTRKFQHTLKNKDLVRLRSVFLNNLIQTRVRSYFYFFFKVSEVSLLTLRFVLLTYYLG